MMPDAFGQRSAPGGIVASLAAAQAAQAAAVAAAAAGGKKEGRASPAPAEGDEDGVDFLQALFPKTKISVKQAPTGDPYQAAGAARAPPVPSAAMLQAMQQQAAHG